MSQDALSQAVPSPTVRPTTTAAQPRGLYRSSLLLVVASAAFAGYLLTTHFTTAGHMEPELLRLLRAMVLIKGVFAAGAGAFVFWRLGQPIRPTSAARYLFAMFLLTGAVVWLWSLTSLLLAAVLFYASLIGLVAIAHTDKAVFGSADYLTPSNRRIV